MSLVLDTSATIASLYPDETTPAILSVMDRVAEQGAWVPSLWYLEIANVLQIGIRRNRINLTYRDKALTQLTLLPIEIDPETDFHAWHATLYLADRHRLTLYDAAYLELALRRGLPLASLDRDLRAAAAAENVQLFGE